MPVLVRIWARCTRLFRENIRVSASIIWEEVLRDVNNIIAKSCKVGAKRGVKRTVTPELKGDCALAATPKFDVGSELTVTPGSPMKILSGLDFYPALES